jgi:hypothetical protein
VVTNAKGKHVLSQKGVNEYGGSWCKWMGEQASKLTRSRIDKWESKQLS